MLRWLRLVRGIHYTTPKLPALALSTTRKPACKIHVHTAPSDVPVPAIDGLVDLIEGKSTDVDVLVHIRASPPLTAFFSHPRRVLELLQALPDDPIQLFRVLELAHSLGCRLRHNAFECIAHKSAGARQWSSVLEAVALGTRHIGRTTVRLLNWRIRGLLELQQYGDLSMILDEFSQQKLAPTRRSFHLLITAALRNSDLHRVQDLLKAMTAAGIHPDQTTHALIARNYRSLGLNTGVQQLALKSLPAVDTKTATAVLNGLLQLHADAHNVAGMVEIMSFFGRRWSGPIIGVLAGESKESLNVEDWPPTGIPPNHLTFTSLLHHFIRLRDVPGGLRIVRFMVSSEIQPTAPVVTAMVNLYFAVNDNTKAISLASEICHNHPTSLQILQALVPHDLPTPSPSPSMLDIKMSTQLCNTLMRSMLPIHGLPCVVDILRLMKEHELQPNSATVEILLGYVSRGNGARPQLLMQALRSLSSSATPVTLRLLHPVISTVLRQERYLSLGEGWNATAGQLAYRRQFKAASRPASPHLNATNILDSLAGMQISVDRRFDPEFQTYVERLSSQNIQPDAATIGLRIKLDAGRDLATANEVFQALVARGMQPTAYHFAALMEGHTRQGDVQGAIDIMKSALQIGIPPNVVLFTIIMHGYARQGMPDLALKTFQDMVTVGVVPDVASIDAVASAFFAVGQHGAARTTLINLWSYIAPFPKELASADLKTLASTFRKLSPNHRERLSREQKVKLQQQVGSLIKQWRKTVNPLHTGSAPISTS